MAQAKLRFRTTPNPDSMDGQFFVQHILACKVTVEGDETVKLWDIPADVLITEVITWVETVLDGTTPLINVGSDSEDDPDNFCNDADGATVNTVVLSRDSLAPAGVHYPTGGSVWAKVSSTGSDCDAGVFLVLIEYINLADVLASPNFSYTIAE